MCGLIAIYDRDQSLEFPNIGAIRESLHHRGPDGFNFLSSSSIFMGHSLLRVESGETDRQPIQSLDGSVTVVVNGELYPYQQLKSELQRKGYQFETESDSELVLALYQFYGDRFLEKLRGEFSCVLWDEKRQLLLAVRDPFGIKPLHYAELNGRWFVGSEAKTIFAAGFPAQWSTQGLSQCFSHQYLKPGYSLFAGIKQLPPGCCLRVESGTGMVEPYYSLSFGDFDADDVPLDIAIQNVKEQLIESIEMRIPSREKCAFSLSGGLDSSAIVNIASKFLGYPPDCYTVSFDHDSYDEYSLVEEFAQKASIRLHKVNVTSDDVIKRMEDAAYYSEGLACNGQYVAKYMLNRAIARDGYRVVMSGEGADEAFMGYAHLHHDSLCHEHSLESDIEESDALHALIRESSLQAGLMFGDDVVSGHLMTEQVPSFLRAKFKFCDEFFALFNREFMEGARQRDEQKSLLALMDNDLSPSFQSNKLWTQVVLTNYILKTLGDGMEMASSVEGRLPFLDHKLFSYAAGLPTQYKLSNFEAKSILRKALKGLVRERVRTRKKHPFIAPPLALTLSDSGFDLVMDKFSSDTFRQNPIFSQKAVLEWVKRWRTQADTLGAELDPALMMLLSFAALQERFRMDDVR